MLLCHVIASAKLPEIETLRIETQAITYITLLSGSFRQEMITPLKITCRSF